MTIKNIDTPNWNTTNDFRRMAPEPILASFPFNPFAGLKDDNTIAGYDPQEDFIVNQISDQCKDPFRMLCKVDDKRLTAPIR